MSDRWLSILVDAFVALLCLAVNERLTVTRHEVEKTKIVQISQDCRLKELEGRVKFPRFSKHCDKCLQCREPQATDDGPESLCERGWELMKEDMKGE